MTSRTIQSRPSRWVALAAGAVVLAAGVLAIMTSPDVSAKPARQNLVVFSASWCAKCRQVDPVVQAIGAERGIPVVVIDVDQQNAPGQASEYGLSIPRSELPQVYYTEKGAVKHVFDGQSFRYGQTDAARDAITGQL
ncbi:MAG: thioredoxin family protein [Candidatus Melainabacteria bacterium]